MKFNKNTFIFLTIICLLHLCLLYWLLFSEETSPEVMEEKAVQQQAANNTGSQQTPAQPQSAPVQNNANSSSSQIAENPSTPVSSAASQWGTASKNMPASLQKSTGQIKAGMVIDLTNQKILWSKNADTKLPIASISKLMTALLLMEDVRTHKVSLSDVITVTKDDKNVMKRWGHGCWLAPGEKYTVQELFKAMMICSANDCAYLLARHMSGTYEAFVARMNQRARELGLNSMQFVSANGHPNVGGTQKKENYGSASDIAKLAFMTMQYSEVMKWAGTKTDRIRENCSNPYDLSATNHLLRNKVPGITGLKTGYTEQSGYCIVATCQRENRNVMVIVLGHPDSKQRDALTTSLLNWAYN